MKYETSAGGVIVARRHGGLSVLLLKDKSGNWTFPKGLIESGEERELAAIREISEEVGIKHLKLLASLNPITYFYRWEGTLKKKTVYYYLFLGKGTEIPTPQTDEGILDVKWITWEEAVKIIGYKKTNKKVLKEARAVILSKARNPERNLSSLGNV